MKRISRQYVDIKSREVSRTVTAPVRALPGFIVIGAQRSGSTSLYSYLTQHRDVIKAVKKEVHFFDFNYFRGNMWYRRHFPFWFRVQGSVLTGEATPYYLFHPCAASRVFATIPNVKLVVVLRNPVERAYSHYHDERRKGRETLTFEEAVDSEEERLADEHARLLKDSRYYSYKHRRFSYLSRGRYAEQLKEWFRYFPRSRFFICSSEEFYRDAGAVVDKLCDFLDIERDPTLSARIRKLPTYNKGDYEDMGHSLRVKLAGYFSHYNAELYDLVGSDFGWEQ